MAEAKADARVRSVLEDPSSLAIARVYATAFLDAAGSDAAERVEEFDSFVNEVLISNPEFESMLSTGLTNRDEKVALVDRVVGPFGSEIFVNTLRVIAAHDRLDLLPVILESATLEHEKRNGQQRVEVTSVQPLDADALERVRQQITTAFDFEPLIENTTDDRLIGGLVLRIGNSVYDGSLRNRLNQLAKRMHQGSLHEIQSGRDRFSHPEGD